jgi:transposase
MSYTVVEVITMRPQGNQIELQRRRSRAINLIEQGYTPVEVARIVGVDRRSVRRWKAAYNAQGKKALEAKPVPGRPPKLNERQKERLAEELLEGAQAHGFDTDLWTCPRVGQVIQKQFGVNYHEDHIGRLLHSMGFSPQKPQRRAVERDEQEIQRWVKEEWSRIKKKPVA